MENEEVKIKKVVPDYLKRERDDIIMDLTRRGYPLQAITQIIKVSKQRAWQIIKKI